MKVALCCIGRMENRYAVEYVEHYKTIGFDKIFIYDNNHDGEEHFEDVLQQYVDDGFVDVVDCRNHERWQLSAYNDCYLKHNAEYDWIAFFDFDEFLILVKDKDVKEYLSRFDGYDIVKVNWMIYTDNNLVTDDGRGVLERFTTPMEYDKRITYSFPENNHIKSFIRGGIKNLVWNYNPHTPSMNLKYCNSVGEKSDNKPFQPYNYELSYVKHFTTKTIQEWLQNKVVRGYPDGNEICFLSGNNVIHKFFMYNKETEEKLNFIKGGSLNIINVLIVNYNTQNFTEACIKSINKTTPNVKIYVFDNSNKTPFVNTFNNVVLIDNTKGQIINFDLFLSKYELTYSGKVNKYASAKHSYTIDKCFDIIGDNFILIDSDVLVKKNIRELYDENYIFVGSVKKDTRIRSERLLPYICFLNVKKLKEKNIKYFDENLIIGLSKNGDKYDTGASIVVGIEKELYKDININEYIEHYGAGSWNTKGKATPDDWLKRYSNLWENDNSNLDIFICTHKDFKQVVNNKLYQVINSKDINKKYNGLDDKFYSELFQYFYIAENYRLKDYIGFCHYRRYFSFMDDVPNMNEIFKTNDVVVGKPKSYNVSVKQFYGSCHNIEDFDIIENIIKEKYSDYYNTFERYVNQKMFIPYNMFIMKKEDFLIYIKFIKDVLDEYLKIVGTDIYKRIEDNKDKYLKKNYPNNTVEYQYRIGGYLAERLTGVFICKHFKRARCYNIKITEKKY